MDFVQASELITNQMLTHGLFANGWKLKWDWAKTRFGRCDYGSKTINMSKRLVMLNTDTEVKDTILHEIAHALVGPGHNHDWAWKLKAITIGARPIRCYGAEVKTPQPRFIGTCRACGKQIKRFKRTRRVKEAAYHTVCRQQGKDATIEWRTL